MNDIEKNIISLLELKDRWNYGNGIAISKQAVLIALSIVKTIPSIYKFIETYPLDNGSISIRIGFDINNIIGLIIESEEKVQSYYDDTKTIIDKGTIQILNIPEFITKEFKEFKSRVI